MWFNYKSLIDQLLFLYVNNITFQDYNKMKAPTARTVPATNPTGVPIKVVAPIVCRIAKPDPAATLPTAACAAAAAEPAATPLPVKPASHGADATTPLAIAPAAASIPLKQMNFMVTHTYTRSHTNIYTCAHLI